MEYPNLDLSKVNFNEEAKGMREYLGFTDEEVSSLASIMGEATKKVVNGEFKTTTELCSHILPQLSPKQAALYLSEILTGKVVEAIEQNPVLAIKTLLAGM